METQEDTVFIQNLPKDVTEQMLAEHFGGIGVIKVSFLAIHLYFIRILSFSIVPLQFYIGCVTTQVNLFLHTVRVT